MTAVKHSKHRRGCDCLNRTADLDERVNAGRCNHCDDPYKQALCAYVALFECAYWTGPGTTREKMTEPCLVLRKDCIGSDCLYSSRWVCPGSNPINDTPYLQMERCYINQHGLEDDRPTEFQPCRDVDRCNGVMTLVTDEFGNPLCGFDSTYGVIYCLFEWSFPGVVTCPEFAHLAGTSSSGVVVRCNQCAACDQVPEIDGGFLVGDTFVDCSFGCPNVDGRLKTDNDGNVIGIYAPYDCCSPSTLLGPSFNIPPSPGGAIGGNPAGALDCIMDPLDEDIDVPSDQDYDDFAENPFGFCKYRVNHPDDLSITACSWAEDPCVGPDGCTGGYELENPLGGNDDGCYTKWQLTITSPTTATLEMLCRNGEFAHYTCNDWHCYERSTFTMSAGAYDEYTNPDGQYSRGAIGLPLCLCVAPVNVDTFGDCVNSGQEACCDSGGPVLNVNINVINDCEGNQVYDNVPWPFTRGAPLPCGVSNPFPEDPCLYFAATIPVEEACAEWGGDLFVLMYCSQYDPEPGPLNPCGVDGAPQANGQFRYNFVFYCYDVVAECWVEQGGFCAEYECECLGPNPPAFSYTKACCCEPDCSCCEDEPDTLFASDESGNTITLTKVGVGSYTGTIPAGADWGGCAPYSESVAVTFFCTEGSGYSFESSSPLVTCPGGCPCKPVSSCSPFAWDSTDACCAGYPSECGLPFVITVTE